jgi:hypothetical protein
MTGFARLRDGSDFQRRTGISARSLNDGSFPEVSAQEGAGAVDEFLERYFPVPAPWECDAEAD